MEVLQQYQCPCCGGAIEFDSQSQKMKCPYCDTEFDIEALKEYDKDLKNSSGEDMQWETPKGTQWEEGEIETLRSYICKSCGGEIIVDANTAASSCPYCGKPSSDEEQLSGTLRPDLCDPVKLDKTRQNKH